MTIDLRPFTAGDLDWLTARHRALYARAHGFDDSFGDLVETILRDFLARHDPACEAGWVPWEGGRPLGSIFCVRADATTAKLRLFLVEPEARGTGLGRQLLETCTGFAKGAGYRGMRLWTHAEHEAACALYARAGWRLVASEPVHSFGVDLTEQTWTLDL